MLKEDIYGAMEMSLQEEVPSQDEIRRPNLSIQTAKNLVEKLYGLRIKSITELNSYVDKNYKIEVEESWSNIYIESISDHGYMFKVLNSKDSQAQHVEAEHELLGILKEKAIYAIEPVCNINGKEFSRENISDYSEEGEVNDAAPEVNLVRLLTFAPGTTLNSVPATPTLLHQSGVLLGRIQQAWQGYSHPELSNMDFIWNMKRVPDLRGILFAVQNENNRKIVEDVIEEYEKEIVPNYFKFRKAIIHADFSDHNIIVRQIPSDKEIPDDKYKVTTVIDFGHAQEAYYVIDVAIAIMYLMVDNQYMDPLDAGGHILAGYQRTMVLSSDEFDSLRVLVAGRFIQSLVIGAYTYLKDPSNEYIVYTAVRGWGVLRRFWETSKHDLYLRWREIMKSYEDFV